MTNKPISRIPLEDMTEQGMINCEVGIRSFGTVEDELVGLLDHTDDPEALSITLDWAMQIRDRTGQDWGVCIRVASVAYFG